MEGCDGEVARIKFLGAPQGGSFGTMIDRYTDLAIGLAITFTAWNIQESSWIWPVGVGTMSFIISSYLTKEFEIRFNQPFPNTLANKLKRRDLRILVIAWGCVSGYPLVGLLSVGLITHLSVIWIFFFVYLILVDIRNGK